MRSSFLTVVLAMLISSSAGATVITYDFEDLPLGRMRTFTETKGGVIAMLSTTDPSGLEIYLNSGTFLPPPFLGQSLSNGTGFPITISFSAPLQSASFNFATNNLPFVSFLVTAKAYSGGPNGILLATSTALGSAPFPGAQFPQGIESIFAPRFDTLVISGDQPGLAIDNLTISTVPEPNSFSTVMFAGLICLLKYRSGFSRRARVLKR